MPPPTTSERREKIYQILCSAYVESTGKFAFSVENTDSINNNKPTRTPICEG